MLINLTMRTKRRCAGWKPTESGDSQSKEAERCITLDQPSARRIGPPMKEERHTRDERGVEEQLQLEWGGGIWMGLAASRELPVVYI